MVLSILGTLVCITCKPPALNPYVGGPGARKMFKLGVPRISYFYLGPYLILIMSYHLNLRTWNFK